MVPRTITVDCLTILGTKFWLYWNVLKRRWSMTHNKLLRKNMMTTMTKELAVKRFEISLNDLEDQEPHLGQRWCQQYIPVLRLNAYIIAHRRALGVLLAITLSQDRMTRFLRPPKLLKKENYLPKSKLCYFQFLQHQNAQINARRFQQLFPDYNMTINEFRLDQRILKKSWNL